MVASIGTSNINSVQMFNAMNAFKASEVKPQEQVMPEVSDGVEVNDNSLLQNQNIEEIQQFAKGAGEENLSHEDIKYGITYGRSVIADYSV